MFLYKIVLGALYSVMGIFCYQPPNSDPTGVLVPNLWGVQPNYMKNWAEMPRPVPPSIMGNLGGDQINNNNILSELDERFLEKRQEPQQQNVAFSSNNGEGGMPFIDADAATVAAMQYELQTLVQTKYQAEAAIKMETGEIARTQHEAQEAERALEEATNNVRIISAHLKNAQEEASKAATRALTAQLQMSVHDQLLVTARQKLNSVTAHMIALQADLASAQQRFMLNNSTKELENRAHALNLRPETNLLSMQNGESPPFGNNGGNYGSQQQQTHNSASGLLSPAEFWHQQLDGQQQSPQQQQQNAAIGPPLNWSPFSQLAPQDLQKSPNSPPLFLAAKKI